MQAWHASTGHQLYLPDDPLEGLSDAEKVRLLERVDVEARRIDPRVKQVMASLSAAHEVVLVMASDGTVAADVRPLVRMNVSVIVAGRRRREQGYAGGGGRYGFARVHGERSLAGAGARSGAQRAGQSGRGAGARRHDDRRARARAGPASCCTRRSGTAWKATSTARALRRSRAASASRSRRRSAPSSTTARSARVAARSTSTTKARRPAARR